MTARRIGRLFWGALLVLCATSVSAQQQTAQTADDKKDRPNNEVKLDMVSDTVAQLFDKANSVLAMDMEITMSNKTQKREDYTIDAMGRRVPKATAIKTGGALHNDEPL